MGPRKSLRALMTTEEIAEVAYIANAPPMDVYRWYSDRPRKRSEILWVIRCPEGQPIVDYVAFRRKAPLIDLALARFGFSSTVLRRLYQRAPLSIRVALCANPELLSGPHGSHYRVHQQSGREFVVDLLERGTDDEVRALCSCPDHQDWVYTLLLESAPGTKQESEELTAKIGEDRFELIVLALSQNQRMQTDRSDTPREKYQDGFADYAYRKPFQAAWKLAEYLPADRRWAQFVERLFQRLPRGWLEVEEVLPLIDKWQGLKASDGSEANSDVDDPFAAVRSALIARHLRPEATWAAHEDAAYRLAFLECHDPLDKEFVDIDLFEIDVDDVSRFFRLERNSRLWRLPHGRQAIREAGRAAEGFENFWASDIYDLTEADLKGRHPEWFGTETQDYDELAGFPAEPALDQQVRIIVGQLERLRKQQRHLLGTVLLMGAIAVFQLLR